MKRRIEDVKDEEENAYDSLPESIQDSERGENMQEAIDTLDTACDSIDTVVDSVDETINTLEEIE